MAADGTITRVLNLLIELPSLATGVLALGPDLLVGTPGEVMRYQGGTERPTIVVEGLDGVSALAADGPDGAFVVERVGGRVRRIAPDGSTEIFLDGLHRPGAVVRGEQGELYVSQADGHPVLVIEADGARREIGGFDDAQGVALSGGILLVADVGRHELVAVNPATGDREVAVGQARIGQPVPGLVPAAFCPLAADGRGGFYVGSNGDGSIRTLTRS